MKPTVLIILALLVTGGCARIPPPEPLWSLQKVATPVLRDDLDFDGLQTALKAQRERLSQRSTSMQFGNRKVSTEEYVKRLDGVLALLAINTPKDQVLKLISDSFDFYRVYGGEERGKVLLTSYYEPVIPGSAVRTVAFSQPLYGRPADLLTLRLGPFSERFTEEREYRARVVEQSVVPYYTRQEIDAGGALRGKAPELVWVDPIDAFTLHIQGSGTVRLADGREVRINYADKNGQPYEAVGKFLKHLIPPGKISLRTIEATLRAMPQDERDAYLFKNPSYVFFRVAKERAVTSLGVEATPGRTIAADGRHFPKGALAFLEFSKPVFDPPTEEEPTGTASAGRFVLDQDSGGAIKGPGKIDLFWGRGDDAKRYAGFMKDLARAYYLAPKE